MINLRDIPVLLTEATTRQQERNLSFIQYYKLNSSTNKTWRIYLKNEFKYLPSDFRFSDVKIINNNDSTFYAGIPLDPRGDKTISQYFSAFKWILY